MTSPHVSVLFSVIFCLFLGTQVQLGVQGAKILGLFHFPAHSHHTCNIRLMKELARKGHDVTIVTPFESKEKIPNWKEIVLDSAVQDIGAGINKVIKPNEHIFVQVKNVLEMGSIATAMTLNNTAVKRFLKTTENFDLIIMEAFMNEGFVGFAHHFNCPIVLLCSLGANQFVNHYTGNPAPSSYVAELLLDTEGEKMTFLQRLQNGVVGTIISFYTEYVILPYQDQLMHQLFPTAPYIKELFKKVSLILLNSHVSVSSAKPHLPNMIEIGGFHIPPVKELPKDLKQYLDSSKNGVILFSMGSNFKGTFFKPEVKKVFLEALSKLPYQILWKYEEDLPGKPKNVRIESWLPQNDLLAHPNLKLFITHGGLLSTTEAVYHGVPLVGIPIFGDQHTNMGRAEAIEIGKVLNFNNLEVEYFVATVTEVITNPKYRENVQKRSAIMKDRPRKPLDDAVFWVEHVLRHKGGDHFKTSALELNYFELYQLDVVAFLVVVLFLMVFIPYKILRYCCCRRSKSKEDLKKKKN